MTVTDPEAADSRLRTEGLALSYGRHPVISDLDLKVPDGRVTAIVGPNGCGKSTLLAGLSRTHAPSGGQIVLDGKDIHALPAREVARRLALLPQETSAPETLTVSELIRFGRHPHQGLLRQWSGDDQRALDAALAVADVVDLAERPLDSLSGGQRQRAWIAMAVAQETAWLLLDEPTSALDLGYQLDVFQLIRDLAARGKTVVMVVHDISSACRFADHLVAMLDGGIVSEGPPKDVMTPELVRQLYGVDCVLVPDPMTGSPMLANLQRCRT